MSRLARRARVDHAQTAAALRAQPGVWLTVGEYRSTTSADGIAWMIRTAPANSDSGRLHCLGQTSTGQPRHPLYLPAGAVLEPYGVAA